MPHRFLLLLLLFAAPAAQAQVLFVSAHATGTGDGSSWTNAFVDLQVALAAAPSGAQVWVAAGTYRPGTLRTSTFQLRNGVALYGGFHGDETALEDRDWSTFATILSGDIGTPDNAADNVYHLVTGSATNATAVLDGFTVTGASATGAFPNNRGGGMRTVGGSPTIRNTTFTGNVVRDDGVRAGFGAGMFNDGGSSPTLVNVRFIGNRAEGQAGGGGMSNKSASSPLLIGVTFEENSAGLLGGGMTNDTGSNPTLIDVVFRRNTGQYTGGMDNYQNADPTLWNVTFEDNTATEYGGGMTNDAGSDPRLYNVVFVGNEAQNTTNPGGGGLHNDASAPLLVGVTFAGNHAANGAGGMFSTNGSAPVVRNAVFSGNGTEISGSADVRYAIVRGGFSGEAVLDADPLFVRTPSDGDAGDLHLQAGSPARDAGSAPFLPADARDLDGDGNTTEPLPVDRDGAERVQGSALDLGAYEGAGPVATEPPAGDTGLRLDPPFPNPATNRVTIRYEIDQPGPVQLRVFDSTGREVALLVDGVLPTGEHRTTLGVDGLARGLYLIQLDAGAGSVTRPVILQ
ncbi:MAG TPA: T9SS type A sorting domain-containing protein [Rhodothermales bacterium]|nr:T9SS type A sorting domain-containing protein [Rhodothermales bacterium]